MPVSFEQELTAALPALHAFVRLRLGRHLTPMESVADVVQSVCREALASQQNFQFRGADEFRSWLFTAALRKIVAKDRYHRAMKRDGRRVLRFSDGANVDASLLQAYSAVLTPSQILVAREQLAVFEAAYASLTEPHQEIIALARIAGLPHETIAAHLGITAETSRQRLRRALMRLAVAMQQPNPRPDAG